MISVFNVDDLTGQRHIARQLRFLINIDSNFAEGYVYCVILGQLKA